MHAFAQTTMPGETGECLNEGVIIFLTVTQDSSSDNAVLEKRI
jgi:hypothetical protein